MFKQRFRRVRDDQTELNITAFMNLMVVLVPFLLITAVFSQISVLKLNLPGGKTPEVKPVDPNKPNVQLEVVLRKTALVLTDRNSGVIARFEAEPDANGVLVYPYKKLNKKLQAFKARFPQMISITVLAEPDTRYDRIIHTMDAVRLIPPQSPNDLPGELFPEVGIGSAPALPDAGSTSVRTQVKS